MARQLIIGCAHGQSGTKRGDPDLPWFNNSTEAHYLPYLKNILRDWSKVDEESLFKGYLWKSCIDTGIELMQSGAIDDFRVLCSRGTFFEETERWLNKHIRQYRDEFDDPYVAMVGKSFGGFDAIRAVAGLRRKRHYPAIPTNLMVLVDPDESLDFNDRARKVIPENVDQVITFRQKSNRPPFLKGHIIVAEEGNTHSFCENVQIVKGTRFPSEATIFADELVTHWTVDEYMSEIGYNNEWTVAKLIVAGFHGSLPHFPEE